MRALFDYDLMEKEVEDWAAKYAAAPPFPHIALKGLVDEKMLKEALAEFPKPEDSRWFNCPEKDGELRSKQAIWDFRKMPDPLASILMEMNAGPFTEFIEKLTGIKPLVSDPHLYGGGLHQIGRGGSLGIHCDHNINPRVQLYRRVSVILYLNEDWKDEYGGKLEMWSSDMKQRIDAVAPKFGTLMAFTNSETSFHGHPDPLMCPPERTRKSLATYYDSHEPHPSYAPEHHRALFQERKIA